MRQARAIPASSWPQSTDAGVMSAAGTATWSIRRNEKAGNDHGRQHATNTVRLRSHSCGSTGQTCKTRNRACRRWQRGARMQGVCCKGCWMAILKTLPGHQFPAQATPVPDFAFLAHSPQPLVDEAAGQLQSYTLTAPNPRPVGL